ncbi:MULTISPECIES: Pvc16 family protein [unclassified Mycobacterium]|uniref:Pvc16 family protein n=1 Tax=unclassified Mycobacterium TaxID=2642494 RepID=UPI00068AC0C1|nr:MULTISPECIES: Pvc16 family protein [unclassified Mycobacterium]SEB02403.1 Carboxypeptidase regulatory-like domain-containing protein [Mycobacterium sp. 283mftsu]
MLHQVDRLIAEVLRRKLGLQDDQVDFEPPDDGWRRRVSNIHGGLAVNVYLVDLRENPGLRDPEWRLEFDAGRPQRKPGAMRVDCHYLISAWSSVSDNAAVEKTLIEHRLLYRVLAALAETNPLNPSHFFPSGAGFDKLIKNADLPVRVVPAEGWPKLVEFWGAMGSNSRVKPALLYTVTVPVDLPHTLAGPLVTTRIIEFKQGFDGGAAEQWLQIAGTVRLPDGTPVDGAVVTVNGASGAAVGSASTGADGRFSVGGLQPDGYEILGRKGALNDRKTPTLPGRTGDYDLKLT